MTTTDDFYLGRVVDVVSGQMGERPFHYNPDDLVTHGVVVGMTGSGKTGLCLGLLEEAALHQLPALMIDVKGDITNALLHFPALAAADFEPWLDAVEARRLGKSVAELAADTAVAWQNGLAQWDIHPPRIQQLADSVQFSIVTPGSDAGHSISILSSLQAPALPWDANRELLREQISGTVTALLGLIGLKEIDPVRTREHILLANIFETAWSQGHDLDLATLIMQVQTPPFTQLGVFPVNTFYPEKERFGLAMQLNNILAAPAFQSWITGEPLDVDALLYMPDGRPRHTIFYIAHLPDAERLFFVTLLLTAVEGWMRRQSGSSRLRALLYFDELAGYLPPIANPSSKPILLRLLKQARAFGLGLLLATQNPADVDYKGLSNIGTWFVGKLATDQDKQRLLDGLAGAAEGEMNRRQLDQLLSTLDKRVFLVRNVHDAQPVLCHTRWAMNYLAGPMTREQIPALNALAAPKMAAPIMAAPIMAASVETAVPEFAMAEAELAVPESVEPAVAVVPEVVPAPQWTMATAVADPPPPAAPTRPALPTFKPFLPPGIGQYFLPIEKSPPPELASMGLVYRPHLLAQAEVSIRNRKYGVDELLTHTVLTAVTEATSPIVWESAIGPINPAAFAPEAAPQVQFAPLPTQFGDTAVWQRWQQDLREWLYLHKHVMAKANEMLKLYAGTAVSDAQFHQMCLEAVHPKMVLEVQKVTARYEKQLAVLRQKIAREENELNVDQSELSQAKRDEYLAHTKTAFSLFKRNKRDASLRKRRQAQAAAEEVEESQQTLAALQQELTRLEQLQAQEVAVVRQQWQQVADSITAVPVPPFKKDIHLPIFGVAWWPYHLVQMGEAEEYFPAFIP